MAIFLPSLVKEKEVLGSPEINFLFLKVLSRRSNLRESGHWGYFEKLKVSGNKVKHSLISLSKVHFSLFSITRALAKGEDEALASSTTELMPKIIRSAMWAFLYNSPSKVFSFMVRSIRYSQDLRSFDALRICDLAHHDLFKRSNGSYAN